MSPSNRTLKLVVVALLFAAAYFVLFPEDLAGLESVLRLSQAISPWLYALAGVVLICGTVVRVWGRTPPPEGPSELPR